MTKLLYVPLYLHTCKRLLQDRTICESLSTKLVTISRRQCTRSLCVSTQPPSNVIPLKIIRHPCHRPINSRLKRFSCTDRLPFWLQKTPPLAIMLISIHMILHVYTMNINYWDTTSHSHARKLCLQAYNARSTDTYLAFAVHFWCSNKNS